VQGARFTVSSARACFVSCVFCVHHCTVLSCSQLSAFPCTQVGPWAWKLCCPSERHPLDKTTFAALQSRNSGTGARPFQPTPASRAHTPSNPPSCTHRPYCPSTYLPLAGDNHPVSAKTLHDLGSALPRSALPCSVLPRSVLPGSGGQHHSGQRRSSLSSSGQARTGRARSGQAHSCQARSGQISAPLCPAPLCPAPFCPAQFCPAPAVSTILVSVAPVYPAQVRPAQVGPAPVRPTPVRPAPVRPAPISPAQFCPALVSSFSSFFLSVVC
jgi:hypothetical protein